MIRTQHEPKLDHRKRVCIVTPGYVSSTPRVVKEADALSQAGYNVRVVFTQGNLSRIREFDRILLADKPWSWRSVEWSPDDGPGRRLYYYSKARYHFSRRVPRSFMHLRHLAEHGEGRVYAELARLAAEEHADLYIGHYPAGLAAAAYAAKRWKALLGFDAEDLHTAEATASKEELKRTERIRIIENRYLQRCSHISAVSGPVAEEMARRYSIRPPVVVHNVFPLSERNHLDGLIKDRRDSCSPSLYWYSQRIGEGRGIEDIIRAAGLLKGKVQIHLRGNIASDSLAKLKTLARQQGVEDQVYFHPPVPPTELLSRAVEHDIGLALEQPNTLNHMLTTSNKLFFYLLAGLAVIATDVPGQRNVMATCPEAGYLYSPGDHHALARLLDNMTSDQERLRLCKQAALEAAQSQWNWEYESLGLLKNVETALYGNESSAVTPRLARQG